MKLYDSSVHFPASQPTNSLLCPACQQNQQKIIHILLAFEGNTKQYAEHAKRIEAKYPLCATCSYRVSQRLAQCQEEVLHYQRLHALSSSQGNDRKSKIKLAQQMQWQQKRRKLIKYTFFVPEFLFQCVLIALIFKGPFSECDSRTLSLSFSLAEGKKISLWLPRAESLTSPSACFFGFSASLSLWQILGASWNGRGLSSVIIQILAFSLRALVANFLFNHDASGLTRSMAAVFASAGLAIVVRTGTKNGQMRAQVASKLETIHSHKSFEKPNSPSSALESSSLLSSLGSADSPSTGGFARFATEEHKYHSFANQVSGEVKPWPVRPKPGNFKVQPKTPDFSSLASSGLNNSGVRLRPSRLMVEDPLEVESLFSSFSLSDSPTTNITTKRNGKTPSPTEPAIKSPRPLNTIATTEPPVKFWFIFYNCVLSVALIACRGLVDTHNSLISVVLAATFGLRGFVWPRLSTLQQAAAMTLALLRLLHLALELNNRGPAMPSPIQLVFDVFLILIR